MGDKIQAYIWYCGDEWCNCTQPVIERVTLRGNGPWVTRERLWEGTFYSDASPGEHAEQQYELDEAMKNPAYKQPPPDPPTTPHPLLKMN